MNINVCIPVYNAEKTIEKTIRNLQLQSLKQFKILIYDDGSTDDTYKIIKKLSRDDSRISIARGITNKGRSEARNAILELVDKTSMIAWQDADDLWHPKKLHVQSKLYAEKLHTKTNTLIYTSVFRKPFFLNECIRKKATLIFGNQQPMRINPPKNYDENHIFSKNFGNSPFYLQGTFGPASAYLDIEGFDKTLQWAEDLDIVIRLIANNTKIYGFETKNCLLRYQLNMPSVPTNVLYESIIKAASKGIKIKSLSTNKLNEDILWRKAFYIYRIALLNDEYDFAIKLLNDNIKYLQNLDWGVKLITDNKKLLQDIMNIK